MPQSALFVLCYNTPRKSFHKRGIMTSKIFALLSLLAATNVSAAGNFNGAEPQPLGHVKSSTGQLTVRFPGTIQKNAVKGEAFNVSCSPQVMGFSSWADNDTLWTYNFKAQSEYETVRLQGGT